MIKDNPRILFVCKHNVFRSRLAEHFAKNTGYSKVSSGGIFADLNSTFTASQKDVMRTIIPFLSKPKCITFGRFYKSDIVVIVADDVPKSLFIDERYGKKKIIKWNIPDTPNSKEDVLNVMRIIKKKVELLCKELGGN